VASLSLGQGSVRGRAFKRQSELLTAVSVFDREDLELAGTLSVDEVLVELGKKGVKNSSPNVVPQGWSCEATGPAWRCGGVATDAAYLSFRPSGSYRFPDRVQLSASYQGRTLFDQRIDVESVGLPKIQNDLQGVLDAPLSYSPGGYATVRPLKSEYSGGTWRAYVDGQPMAASTIDDEALQALPATGRDFRRFTFLVPGTVAKDARISYTYDDRWGARLVDAQATGYSIGDPFDPSCQPTISSAASMAAVGGYLCVCGCFPEPEFGTGLLLDGRSVGVGGSSPWVTMVSLADVQPGPHIVSWPRGMGIGAVDFEAVAVGGSIDAEVIQKGGSTNLEFFVNGTRSQVDMEIYSFNTNISIQGGNQQTATTSGGSPNDILRRLWGNEVGPFNVGFNIDLPPCPCGESVLREMEELTVRHPMSLDGEGTLDWPQGGLRLPARFSSEDFLGLAPRPPVGTDPFNVDFRQLGLRVNVGDFAPFTFEARAGEASLGRFSNIEVDERGHLRSADVDADLYTQFAVDYSKALPLQAGLRYEFSLSEWGFDGSSSDLGRVRFEERPGTNSRIVLDNIGTNSDGTLIYGDAAIHLLGSLKVDF
jgi:hypothetical protein